MTDYHGIQMDLSRDAELSEFTHSLLKNFYMRDDEKSPQEAFARAALAHSLGDLEFAQRIYDYASKQWFAFASPLISNAPPPGVPWKALNISCYLTYVGDDLNSLIGHSSEVSWLSVKGGGVGGHWSDVRAVSDKAPGPIPFLKNIDSTVVAYTQGKTRRASYAAFLDVSHPDIIEFMEMRTPTGGDPNRKCFNLHHGVNITDAFMEAATNNQPWDLIDPDTKEVRRTISARELLQRLIETRFRTGEPYFWFVDAVNRGLPESQKRLGLKNHGGNLCVEITQPTDVDRTAVCCLSSLNLKFYEEWKNTTIVRDLVRLLDNAISIFIENAPPEMARAKYSAQMERSIGLGTLGFHSLLQRYSIPFESASAVGMNREVYRFIKSEAVAETELLAKERGPAPDDDTGTRRNMHLIAIAPNANSALIAGSSPSIEPWPANAFTQLMRGGTVFIKNEYLDAIMSERFSEEECARLWKSIQAQEGSIQHLSEFTDWEKKVFKTAFELDQRWLIEHAAMRQEFVCQAQSLNLFFPPGSDKNYVMTAHLKAWSKGLKSLYYLRSDSGKKTKVSQKIERVSLKDYVTSEECLACHG